MHEHFDTDLCRPYPELVEPRFQPKPYRVHDADATRGLLSRGAVDPVRRDIWVPLADDARSVCRHELAHVLWSPRRLPRVAFEPGVLAAIEDARINLALRRIGTPSDLDDEAEAYVAMLAARDAKAREYFALFQRCVASLGTSVEAALRAQVAREPHPIGPALGAWMERVDRRLEAARARRGAVIAPFSAALALARELARELRAFGLLDADGRARTRVLSSCAVHVEGDGLVERGRTRPPRDEEFETQDEGAEPGRMTVRRVPLEIALRARGGLPAWRAGNEGSVVRFVQRWPVDRAIFRRRARARGGTLLIDHSGSMSLGVEDLDRFLLAAPVGMRVAVYSGEGAVGELRVVADGGRRAAVPHLARFGKGNIVDLPALEWLARQRSPRIWVTDGGVTGVGDRSSTALRTRCRSLRRRAAIRRVGSLDEARKLLCVAS
jgi:hypothetical protein